MYDRPLTKPAGFVSGLSYMSLGEQEPIFYLAPVGGALMGAVFDVARCGMLPPETVNSLPKKPKRGAAQSKPSRPQGADGRGSKDWKPLW